MSLESKNTNTGMKALVGAYCTTKSDTSTTLKTPVGGVLSAGLPLSACFEAQVEMSFDEFGELDA